LSTFCDSFATCADVSIVTPVLPAEPELTALAIAGIPPARAAAAADTAKTDKSLRCAMFSSSPEQRR
jgi:hypothetical protein